MSSKNKQNIVKTPIELQLQKINLFNISQQQNMQLQYHILKMLNSITIHHPEIVNTAIFTGIFNQFMDYQQMEAVKMLPLFETFSYRLWNNENFTYQIREKTSFYKIVSNWIIFFELKSGNLEGIQNKFDLITTFMAKQTNTQLERIVMIEEIHEDLKEFIDSQFWEDQQEITINNKLEVVPQQKSQQLKPSTLSCILKILQVVNAILIPRFYRVHPKQQTYTNCTYGDFKFSNAYELVKKCIYFLLKQRNMPSHLQTQVTKIALIYLQSLENHQSEQIVNMLKHLMISTSKAVRFALIVEYVQFYEYLEMMGFQQVIEELQNIIYFRELIIGKKMVEENIMDIGNSMNNLNVSYNDLYIKAGTSKKVYFSNQSQQDILKLDVFVEENDINIKISYFSNFKTPNFKGPNIKKMLFDTVDQLNQYDGTKLSNQKSYWKEERSTSKKLQLKLQHQGLYCIEFDNSYSWVIPKNIKYRFQLYRPFK